jgi:hypothetical protein
MTTRTSSFIQYAVATVLVLSAIASAQPGDAGHPVPANRNATPVPASPDIRWDRVGNSSTGFHSHSMVQTAPTRFERTLATPAKLSAGGILGFGVALAIFFVIIYAKPIIRNDKAMGMVLGKPKEFSMRTSFVIAMLFAGIFITIGGVYWNVWNTPVVFDKTEGWCWKGDTLSEARSKSTDETPLAIPLDDIHAIQVLKFVSSSSNGDRTYYEVNVVRNDGARLVIVCHDSQEDILMDAAMLGRFLEVPVLKSWIGSPARPPRG